MISVLMPAYNAREYLGRAMETVLAQTFRAFELVVINDGSTDDTGAIAQRYADADPRVRVMSHANMGMGRSLNAALATVTNEWVARLDADDEMLPERLERQVAFVREHPEIAVTATLVNYIDEAGRVIGKSSSHLTSPQACADARESDDLIHLHHPAVLARADAIREVGGYRGEYWPADDVDLWNRILDRGRLIMIQPEFLTNYRVHGKSVCVDSSRRAQRKLEWVYESRLCRRRGQAEPTWEAFEAALRRRPLGTRLNQARKDVAKALFKSATLEFSKRRYHRFLPNLAGATLLEPGYVLPKVMPWFRAK